MEHLKSYSVNGEMVSLHSFVPGHGRESFVVRRSPANISEQLFATRTAAESYFNQCTQEIYRNPPPYIPTKEKVISV